MLATNFKPHNPHASYSRLGPVLLPRHLRDQGGHRDHPEHAGAEADWGQEHLHGAGQGQEGEEESSGGEHEAQPQVRRFRMPCWHFKIVTLFRIAYLEDQTTELQEGLKQVRDSLSRTLNTTDIIQVRSLMIMMIWWHHHPGHHPSGCREWEQRPRQRQGQRGQSQPAPGPESLGWEEKLSLASN